MCTSRPAPSGFADPGGEGFCELTIDGFWCVFKGRKDRSINRAVRGVHRWTGAVRRFLHAAIPTGALACLWAAELATRRREWEAKRRGKNGAIAGFLLQDGRQGSESHLWKCTWA